MVRTKCILLCMLTIPFFTGHLQAGGSKVDSIQGIWKSKSAYETEYKCWIVFLEIGRDFIILDDEREDGLVLEEVEGVVLIRKAGLSTVYIRIVVRDDDHIVFEFPGRKIDFIRSSMEEKLDILAPSVAKITGLYRSEDGTLLFEFSENKVVKNGKPLDMSIIGVDQMYRAVSNDIIHFGLTPDGEGRLLYRERPGTYPIVLLKATPEEADEILGSNAAELDKMLVEFANFSAIIPGPGGDVLPLRFNLILEMRYLPEEELPGARRPTLAQLDVFRTIVIQLESKIRDHMNAFLPGQSYTNLMGPRGPELVKAEAMRFVNRELDDYQYGLMIIPEGISKRRITNVQLTSWTGMLQPQQVQQPPEARAPREGRTQPTFKRSGNGVPSSTVGPTKRRNSNSPAIDMFSDSTMGYLQNKYTAYMNKLARQLQESFNRSIILQPSFVATGQVRINFSIAPDGSLETCTTIYPIDGSNGTLHSLSERALIDAFPCDPPSNEMLDDPMFVRMSVTFSMD